MTYNEYNWMHAYVVKQNLHSKDINSIDNPRASELKKCPKHGVYETERRTTRRRPFTSKRTGKVITYDAIKTDKVFIYSQFPDYHLKVEDCPICKEEEGIRIIINNDDTHEW